jgi:hypothetical protein
MAHLLKDDLVFVCIAPIRLTRGAMADPERPAFSRSFLVSVVDVPQDLGEELGSFRKMVARRWPPCFVMPWSSF